MEDSIDFLLTLLFSSLWRKHHREARIGSAVSLAAVLATHCVRVILPQRIWSFMAIGTLIRCALTQLSFNREYL